MLDAIKAFTVMRLERFKINVFYAENASLIGWHCNHLVLGLGLCLLRLNSEELHQHLAMWHSLLLSWYAATQMVRLQSSHSHNSLLLLLHTKMYCQAPGNGNGNRNWNGNGNSQELTL